MTSPRSEAFVLDPGEDVADAPPGFKLRAADTAGALSLLEFRLAPRQSGPDLHLHTASEETFYVLEGEVLFQVGGRRRVLGSGAVARVPRGTPHTFANAGDEPARALTVATPGGLEDVLSDLPNLGPHPSTDDLEAMRRRHGGQHLGPPLRPAL